MDQPIRSAFSFFSKKYERVLLIILFVQIPLLAAYFYISNYMYAAFPVPYGDFGTADVVNGYFMLLLFFFGQIPFIYFWKFEEQGIEMPLRQAFLQSVIRSFHFFLFFVVMSLAVVIGFGLFFLPGLIVMAMVISAPLIAIEEEQSVWRSLRESLQIFKKHHWKIVSLILVFGVIELIISLLIQNLVITVTTSYLAIVLVHVFVNTIFFPLFYLTYAFFIAKWRKEMDLYSIEKTLISE
ncbi:hypothetical protein [Jeotgalibacillus sp. JSM ZJ347]|uniref:hypothetical protein n=1 Tax=Jeotgalibacillus sp. JSM ZJ347 TaxID=3342117 RepID=UPI0035A8C1D6